MREQLLYYAIKYKGEWDAINRALQRQEPYEKLKKEGNYLVLGDYLYPNAFLSLQKPPFVLFYKGDLSLLKKNKITVIGTRTPSIHGKEYTRLLVDYCPLRCVIVSGLAKGIDGYAHTLYLQRQGKCIGIIGSGIDVIYPKEHAQLWATLENKGLLMSEYPEGVPPLKHHFIMRNRLLAALSEFLIVVEAKERSGTFITVDEALVLQREIYTFPHLLSNDVGSGCNKLIEEGANFFTTRKDLQSFLKNIYMEREEQNEEISDCRIAFEIEDD